MRDRDPGSDLELRLSRDLGDAPVPADLAATVAARIRSDPRTARGWQPSPAVVGVAAVCLVLVVAAGALLVSEPPPFGAAPNQPPAPAAPADRSSPAARTTPPAPTATPRDARTDVTLQCGGTIFRLAALSVPENAEEDASEAAAVLRAFLAERARQRPPGTPIFPVNEWKKLAETPTLAFFALTKARTDEQIALLYVRVQVVDGNWQATDWGECSPRVVLGAGIGPAEWELGQRVGPSTTEFVVNVQELRCSSGRSPAGRIVPPEIVLDRDSVTVTFGVRPRPGGQDCQGAPSAPYRVRLSEPLGNRELRDGGVFPARVVTEP